MKNFSKYFPYAPWVEELKNQLLELRNASKIKADITAGITVALVLVPQSMAYAQLAGLPAYYGLYASFLPVIIAAIMGSSRQLSTGPVAIVSLLTAASLEPFATNPDTYISYAILLAFLVGIFQISLGLLRLGLLINFLSHPVVVGFTNAAAIIIATSQLGKIFGVSVVRSEHTYETVWNTLVASVHSAHFTTVAIAIIAFLTLYLIKKFAPKFPNVLIAVVITTLASWIFNFEQHGGKIVGNVPSGLPPFSIPELDINVARDLIITAITIALIGFMEAISIAKAMAAQTRQRLDINQELIGQGASNIVASFFSGYAVSGSFSRSAVNIDSGAVTIFSSIVTGLVVAITLLWLTPLLYNIPQATLAAVIIMAVINLVKFQPIKHAWKVEKHDGVVAITTFVLTLMFAPHLENGILIGVLLSLGLFVFRTMKPSFAELSAREGSSLLVDAVDNKLERSEIVTIVKFSGSLYFANANYFETKMLQLVAEKDNLKYIIVDMAGINWIDSSGEHVLTTLIERLANSNIELLFARIEGIEKVLRRSGFIDDFGEKRFFYHRLEALSFAWNELGNIEANKNPLKHLITNIA